MKRAGLAGVNQPVRVLIGVTLALLAPLMLPAADDGSPPPQPGQLKADTQLPNTVSAPPFTVRDKFDYRIVQSFGLRGVVGGLIGASIGQARNSPREWGQGVEGFSERFGSGVASNLSRQSFAFVLESAFHEDPRYFPSEDRSAEYRMYNALKQVFVCKTDSGGSEFAWARVISNFGAGQFVNIWQPNSTGSVAKGIQRSFIGFGTDGFYNLMQEFVPFTRPRSLRHRH